MTIQQVRDFMDKMNLSRNDGDIDDYWETDLTDSIRIEFMLTHTRWCEGENNDEHELLLFVIDDNIGCNYEPISLLSFTEKLPEDSTKKTDTEILNEIVAIVDSVGFDENKMYDIGELLKKEGKIQ